MNRPFLAEKFVLYRKRLVLFLVWEHRARGGGRLYTRELGDKVEILAKSGKGTQNQAKVIKRVKELYVNKKN